MPKQLVIVERKAQKQLEKLPEETRGRIVKALLVLQDEGFSKNLDIKKLQGLGNTYRIRVGKHRILFQLTKEKTIEVYAVLPRETAYSQV